MNRMTGWYHVEFDFRGPEEDPPPDVVAEFIIWLRSTSVIAFDDVRLTPPYVDAVELEKE